MIQKSIDLGMRDSTMVNAGGEDTALLRSNRSAHAGAGTQAGDCCQGGSPSPSLDITRRSGRHALNLGVWGRAPRSTVALGHMSRSVIRRGRELPGRSDRHANPPSITAVACITGLPAFTT